MSEKKTSILKIGIVVSLIILGIAGGVAYYFYNIVFGPNVVANNGKKLEVFIPTDAKYEAVVQMLAEQKVIINKNSFDWVARKMNYPKKVYPGRYLIEPRISNRDLIRQLRTGQQTPYNVTINNIRTKDQLVGMVSNMLEMDSIDLANLLNSQGFLKSKGFTPEDAISMFISDTYQFNWNTSAEQFFDRMHKEYEKFWTPENKAKAEKLKMTPLEIASLAAIVDEETNKTDEMSDIAGVYLNRVHQGWPLQADPTVKFAIGDFSIKRILTKHLEFESPYNTYLNPGLPPGPIRLPSKVALKAALNPTDHKYMFFCAKEDFSGYHAFAVTLAEHNINARKYQRELDKRKIME